MKNLIYGLLAIAMAIVLTRAIQADNGYVLLGYGEWTVEGSLAFFVLLNLALFALLYMGLRLMVRIWSMPNRFHAWREQRTRGKAHRSLTRGLVALSEGNWKQAERDLIRFAGKSEAPMVNYLAAARSAQQQGAHDRRDNYLQLAHASMPSADVAVGLTQAELQLSHEQLEQALATLKHLRGIAPKHTHVLKLLKVVYERLGDWQELGQLLPELKKRKVIEKDELLMLEHNIYRDKLHRAAQAEDPAALNNTWQRIPWPLRTSEAMISIYANHLINRGDQAKVEQILREAIGREWSDTLVELYGRVGSDDVARQLSTAEGWLKGQSDNPVLLLTLARLSLRSKLWGKARSYYEASIAIAPSVDAYRELGILLERMGEQQQAMTCFREGLGMTSDLPLPELPATLAPAKLEGSGNMPAPPDISPPKQGGEAGEQ